MKHAKWRATQQTPAVMQVPCGPLVARMASQRIDLGGWRVTIWQDEPAADSSTRSFWRTPGLYARRLARSR